MIYTGHKEGVLYVAHRQIPSPTIVMMNDLN